MTKVGGKYCEDISCYDESSSSTKLTGCNDLQTGGEVSMARVSKLVKPAVSFEPPAMTPEDREDQLIALAVDLAEQRLRDGTASNQLIAEIMKLGTTKERLQKEKLQRENEMLKAKTEAIEAQKHTDEMYVKALNAMKSYSGFGRYEDEYEDD